MESPSQQLPCWFDDCSLSSALCSCDPMAPWWEGHEIIPWRHSPIHRFCGRRGLWKWFSFSCRSWELVWLIFYHIVFMPPTCNISAQSKRNKVVFCPSTAPSCWTVPRQAWLDEQGNFSIRTTHVPGNLLQVLAELGVCLTESPRLFDVSNEYFELNIGRSFHYRYDESRRRSNFTTKFADTRR